MRTLFAAVILLSGLVAQAPLPTIEPLFDGSTLRGWAGDPQVWSVRDGAICGSTVGNPLTANTFLVWQGGDLADFELQAEVRLEGDNNSGIQYRSRPTEAGGFGLAGYQCDVHPHPPYTAMLYEERGAGIVAQHGQFVARDHGGAARKVGDLAVPVARDLTAWHTLRIVAKGALVTHELDGALVTAFQDDAATAPRQGRLGLQVHSGAPMTVWFRNLQLRRLPREELAMVPTAITALLAADRLAAAAGGEVPQWIWHGAATADQEAFFRRAFTLPAAPGDAQLAVTCDNHCRVYVNGEKVAQSDHWESPVQVAVGKQLRAGENVIAVHASNDGGPAGLVLRLNWSAGGKRGTLVSDGTFRASDDDPDGYTAPGFDDTGWANATVQAPLGAPDAPWSGTLGADGLGSGAPPDAPQVAVPATGLAGPLAAGAVQLLAVPRAFGSWVAMCADDRGRLYASDQARGLYRVVPAAAVGGTSTLERVEVDLGGCQGLCWFRGALYAVANGRRSGLVRITDRDGDDRLDHLEWLRELPGNGEHGPHAVVPAPDGEHLLVLCGNHTRLPELAGSAVPTHWAEDRLPPKIEDPNGHAVGIQAPGGYVCRVTADGARWELLCCGFRNAYDLAVRPDGRVFTYDADMEWDMGLPWYRPTRILEVLPVDYGWRSGSNKWPVDYPDAPESVCDLGPGSPTGMVVHGNYVLALDWTFGTVHGVPLDATVPQVLLTGAPLPLTDAVSHGGRLYLLTGGRGVPSKLFAITAPLPEPILTLPRARFQDARELAALLPRARDPQQASAVLAELATLPFASYGDRDAIAWLRLHALVLLRGELPAAAKQALGARLLPLFPTGRERLDAELAEILAFVDAPGLLDKVVPMLSPLRPAAAPAWTEVVSRNANYGGPIRKMLANMPPTGQLALANALRLVRHGWTLEQRRAYFTFLAAARKCHGGASYDGYLKAFVDEVYAQCSPAEQQALAELVGKAKAPLAKFASTPPKGPGRAWTVAEAQAAVGDLAGADLKNGHNLFHAIGCAACHYFAGEGGVHGPDLTSAGNKFGVGDLLEAIVEPSRVISDQYAGAVLTKRGGGTLFGHVVPRSVDGKDGFTVVPAVADAVAEWVPATDVVSVEPSKLSPMPAGLVNGLHATELRDLLAFLRSRGALPW